VTDFKDRVRQAVEKHHAKQLREPRKKPNGKPEKEVEKACMAWLRANGFSCSVVESKAVYSEASGRYMNGQTDAGFADCVGVHDSGTAVFIEFKAKGRLSTLRPAQKAFLREKIRFNAFAIVVDSAEMLAETWRAFVTAKETGPTSRSPQDVCLRTIF
jgi:hypothetical protein